MENHENKVVNMLQDCMTRFETVKMELNKHNAGREEGQEVPPTLMLGIAMTQLAYAQTVLELAVLYPNYELPENVKALCAALDDVRREVFVVLNEAVKGTRIEELWDGMGLKDIGEPISHHVKEYLISVSSGKNRS